MKEYNLEVIQANVEQMLLRSCEELDQAITAYGLAVDAYADDFANYRRAKADVIKRLKTEGKPVTIISDLAQGETADIKAAMLKSEGLMKKTKMLVDGYIERIQAIKYIGNRLATTGR